jgi:hypothetical protein
MKRLFAVLLSLIVLATLPVMAQQPESMRVNADRVNLRKSPSIDSSIVRSLAKGTVVAVLARDGNWVKVQLPGQPTNGWVRSDLLTAVPATASTVPAGMNPAKASSAPSSPAPVSSAMQPGSTPPAAPKSSSKTLAPPPAPKPVKPSSSSLPDGSYHGGFTIYGGMAMYKITETPSTVTTENATGFAAGLGIIAHLGGPIGIELDAQYVQQGFAQTESGVKTTVHENYAGGALLLRPAFGSGRVRFFVQGGAQAGYLLSCAYSGGSTCTISSTEQTRIDYGALVGGGISFGPLAVQVRYNFGVANLSKVSTNTVKSTGLMVLGSLIF